jgi:cytosine permease
MANGTLPAYLASAKPNPLANRAPWYKNTAQTYAGIFLWIAFYDKLAGDANGPGALGMGGLGVCLIALIIAGLISHVLFYVVPGMLGMKTGLPLYIVGTSTFGTKGGYFLPGIFMGLLQIGWYSVATYYSTKLVLGGLGLGRFDTTLFGPGEHTFSAVFVIMAVIWGYLFAFFGGLGINMVAKLSTYFPIVPIAMLIVGGVLAVGHLGKSEQARTNTAAAMTVLDAAQDTATKAAAALGKPEKEAKEAGKAARAEMAKQKTSELAIKAVKPDEKTDKFFTAMKLAGFLLVIQLVIGFFATAGACGADFCSNNRDAKDVQMGGLVGIALAILFTGGLGIIAVAGAQGALVDKVASGNLTWGDLVNYQFFAALPVLSKTLGTIMLILFAIGSMAPASFCSFIIGNSLSTMLAKPQARVKITMAGATIGIIVAALGLAGNLEAFFGLIGASFGPVLGAMTADYLLSGKKWAGPREGISIPGYAAWIIGFIVGVSNNGFLFGDNPWVPGWFPTGVASMVVGFIVYAILAKAGLEAKTVPFAGAEPPAQPSK